MPVFFFSHVDPVDLQRVTQIVLQGQLLPQFQSPSTNRKQPVCRLSFTPWSDKTSRSCRCTLNDVAISCINYLMLLYIWLLIYIFLNVLSNWIWLYYTDMIWVDLHKKETQMKQIPIKVRFGLSPRDSSLKDASGNVDDLKIFQPACATVPKKSCHPTIIQ